MLDVSYNNYRMTCNMQRSKLGTYNVCLLVHDRVILQQVWGQKPTREDFINYLKEFKV